MRIISLLNYLPPHQRHDRCMELKELGYSELVQKGQIELSQIPSILKPYIDKGLLKVEFDIPAPKPALVKPKKSKKKKRRR